MARNPDAYQQAARIRAARAYAGLDLAEVYEPMNFSRRTWTRVESGARPLEPDEVERLAAICQVPASFLRDGFVPAPDARAITDRLDQGTDALRGLQEDFRIHDQFVRSRAEIRGDLTNRLSTLEDAVREIDANLRLLLEHQLERELEGAAERAASRAGSTGGRKRAQGE